jgi:hypothetical protein
MAVEKPRLRRNRLAAAVIAAVGLAALTLPSAPVEARVFVGIGVGVPGVWGYYPTPYYPAYYYGYPYYYRPYAYRAYYGWPWHPYWHPYWRRGWHRDWHRHWR